MKINKNEIVAIGHDENSLVFNAVGIKGYVCLNDNELIEKINELVSLETKIFIISDKYRSVINEIRSNFNTVYPIFLLLPLDGSTNSDGIDEIRKNVERATGISLI